MESAVNMDLACAALSAALANKMAVIRYIASRNKDVSLRSLATKHALLVKRIEHAS